VIGRFIFRALAFVLRADRWRAHDERNDQDKATQRGFFRRRHMRGWLTWAAGELGIEWAIFCPAFPSLGLSLSNDEYPTLTISFIIGSLYISPENFAWTRKIPDVEWQIKYGFHTDRLGGLRWSFGMPSMEWSNGEPWWRRGHFEPYSFVMNGLFGRERLVRDDKTDPVQVSIPMPEATYTGTFRIEFREWKRPRAWWTSTVRRSGWLDIEGGIPVPGKGESAWDCGQDAIHGVGSAPSKNAAILRAIEAATDARLKYGGLDWRPKAKAKA